MSRRPPEIPLAEQLVLAHWALGLLGLPSWDALPTDELVAAEDSAPGELLEILRDALPLGRPVGDAELGAADSAVRQLAEALRPGLRWRWFQHLTLVLSELYLDRLLGEPDALLADVAAFAGPWAAARGLPAPTIDAASLRSPALGLATGAGKTLLLHAQLLQHRRLRRRHGRAEPPREILITPGRDLARQHLAELQRSGIPCSLLEPHRPPGDGVLVADIGRFREVPGPETLGVDAFAADNLLLVDEGHRGSSRAAGEWLRIRRALQGDGVALEYSATFAAAADREPSLGAEYGRRLLVDYDLRRFHGDGYGKSWQVMDLSREGPWERRVWMAGALAVLAEQLDVLATTPALADHGFARPLGAFVGRSVMSGGSVSSERSDVLEVLSILDWFAAGGIEVDRALEEVAAGAPSLGDRPLNGLYGELPAEQSRWHALILRRVFGTTAPGRLRLEPLAPDGEIELRIGDGPAFGLVHVGDGRGVAREAAAKLGLDVRPRPSAPSAFARIDAPDSPTTLLIGSRRFHEGWSSFRVGLLVLLNLGRGAGTLALQLLGRGLRLRGLGGALKRSPDGGPPGSLGNRLAVLQTLRVFGLRATYLAQLDAGLAAARLQRTPPGRTVVPLSLLASPPLPWLPPDDAPPAVPRLGGIELDLRARVVTAGGGARGEARVRTSVPLLAALDHGRLRQRLLRCKLQRGWHEVALPPTCDGRPLTQALLQAPGIRLRGGPPGSLDHRDRWQSIAGELLVQGCARWVAQRRRRHARRALQLGRDDAHRLIPDAWRLPPDVPLPPADAAVEPAFGWTDGAAAVSPAPLRAATAALVAEGWQAIPLNRRHPLLRQLEHPAEALLWRDDAVILLAFGGAADEQTAGAVRLVSLSPDAPPQPALLD